MGVQEDYRSFADWLKAAMEAHGITSSRQARIRLGIAHTTIESLAAGTKPSVETAIRLAGAFKADVPGVLRLAGHADVATALDGIPAPSREPELIYERLPDDEEEMLAFYRGVPDALKAKVKSVVGSFSTLPYEEASPPIGGREPRARYDTKPRFDSGNRDTDE